MAVPAINLPRPVQLVIDDVGWREGWSEAAQGGPFRAGVARLLGPADYHAVADLGQAMAIRPQCAMVLCEWDRENVCARFPTTTRQGAAWDNSARAGPWAEEAAQVFADRAAHIEFAMHGVGHEHWDGGVRTRAEWLGRTVQDRWPWAVLQGHLECFRLLLAQYGLDPAHGISLPPSFVPCAFRYYWDKADPESTGALVTGAGVRFCSTVFATCTFAGEPPERPDGGFDHGLLVLDRGDSGVRWHEFAAVPRRLPRTSICGVHWPNLLMPEPERNPESVAPWVGYLERIRALDGWMLAANMAETCSQWLAHTYASLSEVGDGVELNAAPIPALARERGLAGNPIVKAPAVGGLHLRVRGAEGCRPVASWTRADAAFVALRLGPSARCRFQPDLGSEPMPLVVLRDGTFDVLDLEERPGGVRLALRLYGRQRVRLRMPFAPAAAESSNPRLTVHALGYDAGERVAALDVQGRDIHGEEGEILLRRA